MMSVSMRRLIALRDLKPGILSRFICVSDDNCLCKIWSSFMKLRVAAKCWRLIGCSAVTRGHSDLGQPLTLFIDRYTIYEYVPCCGNRADDLQL